METNALFSKKVLSGNCGLGEKVCDFLDGYRILIIFVNIRDGLTDIDVRNLFPALSLVIGALNQKSQKLKQNSLDVNFIL